MPLAISTLKDWYQKHFEEIKRDFFTFLNFPSISTDPRYAKETQAAADWLCAYLKKIGLGAELWKTPGYPCVFGSYLKAGKGRPTLLIYHHYDVQPVDPLELWESDPFKPVIKNNQVYARGALDNKGQCFYSLCAIQAFLSLAKQIGVNIKVFIEGEEESGGKGTAAIIAQKKKELQADYLLIVDADLPEAGVPGITLGIRGIMTMTVECRNSSVDLHSGTHGGIALNPNRALVSALGKLWDEEGRIAIPHFYDDVKLVLKDELNKFDTSFDIKKYQKAFGVRAFAAEKGVSVIESNWMRPTLELNGIGGGYTGLGFKTVIPAVATAKISCRLVPDQDPEKVGKRIGDFLRAHMPKELEVKIELLHGAPAFRSDLGANVVKKVAAAFEEIFAQPCRFLLCGASIPIVVDLAKITGAETCIMGFGLAEDNIHAPNEHFGMDRFEQGFLTMAKILSNFSEEGA